MIRLLSLFSVFSFLLFSNNSIAQVKINNTVKELEANFEARVFEDIKTFFGPKAKVLVNVTVKPSNQPQNTEADTSAEVGYFPVPYAPGSIDAAGDDVVDFAIETLTIDIKVPQETDEAVIASIKELVSESLKKFTPEVNVAKLPSPSTPFETIDTSSLPDLGTILMLIVALFSAALLTAGIFLVSKSMKTAAVAIADGLQLRVATTDANKKEKKKKEEEPKKDKVKTKTSIDAKAKNMSFEEHSRNIQILKQILKDSPVLFVQAFNNTEAEMRGVKWILPALSTDEQSSLKKYLGKERVNQLTALDEDEEAADNYMVWLQEFVERLMIRKIEGGSQLEKMLGPEKTLKLYVANAKHLFEAATSVDSPAGWRIAAEFLAEDKFQTLLGSVDQAKWKMLVSASEVSQADVDSASNTIIQVLEQPRDDEAQKELKEKYFKSTLLDPVIESLQQKDLGQDDEYLESLQEVDPDFVSLIREKMWTLKTLEDVPNDVLKKAFKSLDNDQKVGILIVLPEALQKKFQSLLPEGNVKTIVMDQFKKVSQKADEGEIKEFKETCRAFIEDLRDRCLDGEFSLMSKEQKQKADQTETQTEVPETQKNAA